MKEKNNIIKESYYEGDLSPSEVKQLRDKYPALKKHFTSFQNLDVFKRNEKVVALRIDYCIIYTHRGIFMRSYVNRILDIAIKGWDNNYLYVVVDNKLNRVKRLDISLPIIDNELIKN